MTAPEALRVAALIVGALGALATGVVPVVVKVQAASAFATVVPTGLTERTCHSYVVPLERPAGLRVVRAPFETHVVSHTLLTTVSKQESYDAAPPLVCQETASVDGRPVAAVAGTVFPKANGLTGGAVVKLQAAPALAVLAVVFTCHS